MLKNVLLLVYLDIPVLLNHAKFRANGESGYLLKPACLRDPNTRKSVDILLFVCLFLFLLRSYIFQTNMSVLKFDSLVFV